MDDLQVAISNMEKDPNLGWAELKEAMDRVTDQFNEEPLENLISEHRDLPKLLTDVAKFFSHEFWCVSSKESSTILISYLRLVRKFYHQQPLTNLEKSANDWVMAILERLSDEVSTSEQHNQSLALAMVNADFVPDKWIEDVAEPRYMSALRSAERASSGLIWTLPGQDLRKLLTWGCCLAKLESYRLTVQSLIESLELADGILAHDCLLLFQQLQKAIKN